MIRYILGLMLVFCLFRVPTFAQDAPEVANGMSSSTVYHTDGFDFVNTFNGRLNLHIPLLVDHSQRGKLNFTYSVYYTSSVWEQICEYVGGGISQYEKCWYGGVPGTGFTFGTDGVLQGGGQCWTDDNTGYQYCVDQATESDGSAHNMGSLSASEESIDGSGIRFDSTNGFTNKDGVHFHFPGYPDTTQWFEDPNGNKMSFTGTLGGNPSTSGQQNMTDTLGRVWTTSTATSSTAGCPVYAANATTFQTPSGLYKLCYSYITISTNLPQTQGAVPTQVNGQGLAMTGIVLPDSTTWRFDYDSYGDITTAYLPTGGTVQYTYGLSPVVHCWCDSIEQRIVTSRVVNDGVTSQTWNYVFSPNFTVSDPLNDTVYTASGVGNAIGQIQHYSGRVAGGNVIKTENRSYQSLPNPYRYITGGAYFFPLLTNTKTTLGSQQSQVSLSYDSGFTFTDESGDSPDPYTTPYGLLTQQNTYDWGTNAVGGLLSSKRTSYYAFSNSTYIGPNLLNLPGSNATYDANGTKYSETDFNYDDPARLVPSNISTQRVAAPASVRGNLTSISQWTGGSNYLTTYQNVYDTGLVNQVFSPRSSTVAAATYTYDPAFAGAYPTKSCNALTQCTNFGYDGNTGLMTSMTDVNGQTTTFGYDAMQRPSLAIYPDMLQDTASYSATSANFSQAIVAGENLMTTKISDGMGRLTHTQITSDPQPDTVDTTYDALGRVASVSNPHRASTSSTDGTSYYNYDAIGRVTQFIPQDGSSSANYVSTQYSGNETIVTDEVGHQKNFFNDGLGRLTRVDEPLGNPASGSATITGFDQVTGTPGTGTATVGGGPEQSCCSAPATQSSGNVTITGYDHCGYFYDPYGDPGVWECTDGDAWITVGSFTAETCPTSGSTCPKTAAAVLANLASQLNSSGLVTSSVSGNTIYLTSTQTGNASNYSLSVGCLDDSDWYTTYGYCPYNGSASGATMTGGTDAKPTIYDTGTVSVTVNGFTATANYDQNSSYNSLANAIANAFNGSTSSPVSASVASNSSVINLTARTNGASTNYSLTSGSATSQPGNFSHVSYSMSVSGASLINGTTAGLYDTGTVWVTVNGFQASATYGQSSTSSSLATAIAGVFNASNSSPVAASASGGTVNLIARAGGLASDYTLSAGSATSLPASFSQASFSTSTSGGNLSGGSAGWTTTLYLYDPLGNLTGVNESGSRFRSFGYDPLSRLISAINPESGTIVYHYDQDASCPAPSSFPGLLVSKTDARGIRTCIQYDPLNRVTQKNYNDNGVTPTVTFTYDSCSGCPSGFSPGFAVGHLVEAATANARTFYGYDKRGRTASQTQCTPLNCGSNTYISFNYSHSSLGGQTSMSYNNAFTITQNYDPANRVNQVTSSYSDQYNPSTLVSVSQFWPTGQPNQISFGNGLAEIRSYNSRLQPTQLRVYKISGGDVLNEQFTWSSSGLNNGNLVSWAASGSGTPVFNRSYTYDSANRLATMSSPADPSGCTGASWSYDDWGNRTAQTTTGGSCGQSAAGFTLQNQIVGYGYDAAGNLTNVPSPATATYTYDAENRLTRVVSSNGTISYVYDANGQRVEKITPTAQTHYFYDEAGNVAMELNQSGAVVKDYIYSGGRHIAEISGGKTYFAHTDHLGSTRTVTDYAGNVPDFMDYMPYGEQIAGGSFTTHKFTGYERDSESGLDDALARYNASSAGRLLSPDPGNAAAQLNNPQNWNGYAYAENNPLRFTDPTGLASCSAGNENTAGLDGNDGYVCRELNDDSWWNPLQMPGQQLANDNAGKYFTGQTITSPFGFQYRDDNGVAYPGLFNSWDEYAAWATYIPVLAEQTINYIDGLSGQYNRLVGNMAALAPGVSIIGSNPQLVGGHFNFNFTCSAGTYCPGPGRYDNGIHVEKDGLVHDDTVSPWISPFSFLNFNLGNFLEHGFVDLIGGQLFIPVFPN